MTALITMFTLIFSLAVGFLPLYAISQSDLEREDPIRVEVEAVNLLVSVHDKTTGAFISNLSPEDFVIYENGVRQEITNFTEETNLPLSIALCIDTSSSVRIKLKFEKEAASDFLFSVMTPKDKALLLEFDTAATLLHDFTSNPNKLTHEISRLRAGGGTSLYDAVCLVSEQKLKDSEGRKVLVILSDGADQTSVSVFDDALRAAFQAEAAVYTISTARFGADIDHEGDNALRQLSSNTGGRSYFPLSTGELSKSFKSINEELRNQYSITYIPIDRNRDGSFRKLRVKLKYLNKLLFYRKGYFSPLETSE